MLLKYFIPIYLLNIYNQLKDELIPNMLKSNRLIISKKSGNTTS